ncbi:MAG: DEAD/DEAH box helicase, partial [Planctomycetes bacterium]|nr:DEAD/DEAH box helicase [Planctomycetota bacterium]
MSIGQFAAGARVEIRDEEWIVNGAKPEASGGQAVQVTGVSELVRGKNATFLTEIDEVIVLQPEETELVADTSSRFAKTRLYLESLYRRTPPTDSAIHLGHLAAIDEVQYQLRPASKALSLLRPRFLMADGVGLGKTIEVGILLTELMQRGRGRRILVVAMKSILAQFQEELWGRFTIPLVRLDSVGIQRVQTKIPSSMNPFHFYERVIVSVDTLKNDTKYRKHLEDCHWDVIVVDECQNVAMRTKTKRGQGSQRAQLAKLLATHCDSLILTSATPHDGSEASFASLIHLLEPTAIADVNNFTREDVEPFFQRKFKKDVEHEIDEAFPPREVRPHRL